MNECRIRVIDLVKHYEGGAIRALDGVTLDIPCGEFLCLMGPSGSGKSTLLHLIGALDVPTRGEVILNGRPLALQPDLDRVRLKEVGFVFQLHNLIPTLTAAENVEIPMLPLSIPRQERRRRSAELLDQVGLGHRRNSIVTKLSGGERQRVAIARALANRPGLILADEPTGDVDSKTGELIMQTLLSVKKQVGSTLVVVTHNPEITAGADRVLEMRDGRVKDESRVASSEPRVGDPTG